MGDSDRYVIQVLLGDKHRGGSLHHSHVKPPCPSQAKSREKEQQKDKEKEKEARECGGHHLAPGTFSSLATCSVCCRSLQRKQGLQCQSECCPPEAPPSCAQQPRPFHTLPHLRNRNTTECQVHNLWFPRMPCRPVIHQRNGSYER